MSPPTQFACSLMSARCTREFYRRWHPSPSLSVVSTSQGLWRQRRRRQDLLRSHVRHQSWVRADIGGAGGGGWASRHALPPDTHQILHPEHYTLTSSSTTLHSTLIATLYPTPYPVVLQAEQSQYTTRATHPRLVAHVPDLVCLFDM